MRETFSGSTDKRLTESVNDERDLNMASKNKRDAEAIVSRARRSLGISTTSQQDLLRKVRKALSLENAELAGVLEVSEPTLRSYLAPDTAKRFRTLPESSRLLLQRILAEHKASRSGGK